MKNNLIFIAIILFLFSCKKEKFGIEYIGELEGSVMIEGELFDYHSVNLIIHLSNETSENILFEGNLLTKSGRTIKGLLPYGGGLTSVLCDSFIVNLKKNLFNDDIQGTFISNVHQMPGTMSGSYPSQGTITMKEIK